MSHFLTNHSIPETQKLLDSKGLYIDLHTGFIFYKNVKKEGNHGPYGTATTNRPVVAIIPVGTAIGFTWKTTKGKHFPRPFDLKLMDHIAWFDFMEELAHTLAREAGFQGIIIHTGRKDAAYVKSRGYEDYQGYWFQKHLRGTPAMEAPVFDVMTFKEYEASYILQSCSGPTEMKYIELLAYKKSEPENYRIRLICLDIYVKKPTLVTYRNEPYMLFLPWDKSKTLAENTQVLSSYIDDIFGTDWYKVQGRDTTREEEFDLISK